MPPAAQEVALSMIPWRTPRAALSSAACAAVPDAVAPAAASAAAAAWTAGLAAASPPPARVIRIPPICCGRPLPASCVEAASPRPSSTPDPLAPSETDMPAACCTGWGGSAAASCISQSVAAALPARHTRAMHTGGSDCRALAATGWKGGTESCMHGIGASADSTAASEVCWEGVCSVCSPCAAAASRVLATGAAAGGGGVCVATRTSIEVPAGC